MKKEYLKPEVARVDLCPVCMLAASMVEEMPIKPEQGGAAGTGANRGEWVNLWK